MRIFLALWVFMAFSFLEVKAISLPAIFGDHMVIQRDSEVTIWGWGKAQEPLSISVSWDAGFLYKSVINNQGIWQTTIKTPKEAGPHVITIKGYNTIVLNDVLAGEVWLLSGQSNMEWSANAGIDGGEMAKQSADFPEMRFFRVPHKTSDYPQDDLQGFWEVCTPETMGNFSAAGYFFGKEIHEQVKVPVGLIQSAWGGTPAEIWTPEYAVQGDKILREASTKLRNEPWGPNKPGVTFNAMIHPLAPYKLAGVLWYQGETNTVNAKSYSRLLSTMITSWRAAWGDDFAFYLAQIAPYKGYGKDNNDGAIIRAEQVKVVDLIPKTDMIVVSDIGDLDDIHPRNKIDVGKRFAGLAFKNIYQTNANLVGFPRYQSHEIKAEMVLVHFQNAPNGLKSTGSDISGFEVQSVDDQWYPASARISGADVMVQSASVKKPKNVRFAMKNDSSTNLFNKEGLPASCFTTGKY
ncbi:MAG: sialate O-acetylesterase [Saprospiraceae bacterium]|nr:sialate O-acetylesterase [Saprospiraceae bacterium]